MSRDARVYGACTNCDLHFLDPALRLDAEAERGRYDLHTHDPNDEGYLRFVGPLIERLNGLVPRGAVGLDFGAGRVPVLAEHLRQMGFSVSVYDAFYWPDAAALEQRYDFVVACEVVEHFYDPAAEFARLRRLLREDAPLILMTELRCDRRSFEDWTYRRDPTHVTFYSERTFRWLADSFGFKNMTVDNRVVSLFAPGGSS